MKSFRLLLIIAISLISLLASGLASADSFRGGYYRDGCYHGGHHGSDFNVVVGGSWGPWWGYQWPYYYPYYPYGPYYSYPYYYSPSVAVPGTHQSYIERDDRASSPVSSKWPSDWFYCPRSGGYYPYVKECPGGWQTVPSSPPPGSGEVKTSNSSPSSGVWYYCRGLKAYYPYVKKCPGGWLSVPAKPAAGEK